MTVYFVLKNFARAFFIFALAVDVCSSECCSTGSLSRWLTLNHCLLLKCRGHDVTSYDSHFLNRSRWWSLETWVSRCFVAIKRQSDDGWEGLSCHLRNVLGRVPLTSLSYRNAKWPDRSCWGLKPVDECEAWSRWRSRQHRQKIGSCSRDYSLSLRSLLKEQSWGSVGHLAGC